MGMAGLLGTCLSAHGRHTHFPGTRLRPALLFGGSTDKRCWAMRLLSGPEDSADFEMQAWLWVRAPATARFALCSMIYRARTRLPRTARGLTLCHAGLIRPGPALSTLFLAKRPGPHELRCCRATRR